MEGHRGPDYLHIPVWPQEPLSEEITQDNPNGCLTCSSASQSLEVLRNFQLICVWLQLCANTRPSSCKSIKKLILQMDSFFHLEPRTMSLPECKFQNPSTLKGINIQLPVSQKTPNNMTIEFSFSFVLLIAFNPPPPSHINFL